IQVSRMVDNLAELANLVIALFVGGEVTGLLQPVHRSHRLDAIRVRPDSTCVSAQVHIRLPDAVVCDGEQRVFLPCFREGCYRLLTLLGCQRLLTDSEERERRRAIGLGRNLGAEWRESQERERQGCESGAQHAHWPSSK